jgi:hypothetical protein
MIVSPSWLLGPYILNILILVPVCYSMFFGGGISTVFEGKVDESQGLRLLVGSLWFAILIASIGGLIRPTFFAPVILIQTLYKAFWLVAFIAPLWLAGKPVPIGISTVFALTVLGYPIALWLATRSTP